MRKVLTLSLAAAVAVIFCTSHVEAARARSRTRVTKRRTVKRRRSQTPKSGVFLAAQPVRPTAVRVAPKQAVLFCVQRESLWGASLEMNDAMVAGKPILYWRKAGGQYLKPPFTFGPFFSERNPSAQGSKAVTLCAQVTGTR